MLLSLIKRDQSIAFDYEALSPLVTAIGATDVISYRLTPILFLAWFYSVVRQTNGLGFHVGASPTWAVGWWFVPLANFVQPLRIIQRIVRALNAGARVPPLQMGIWWSTFLLSRTLRSITERMPLGTFSFFETLPRWTTFLALASPISAIIAAVLCHRIVRVIQDRLDNLRTDAPRSLALS
ncbi:DUF4328 domain-containing protein [Myxococcus sp. AM011]|uniref:DUF4328 domain-containing protein n=1 Tax=Myxococcus sp. AM011 TaxID=2745200 RepID=UPI001595BAF5|nr:DUF4328 domain-containing protein [Myxococcus sp. AM011]